MKKYNPISTIEKVLYGTIIFVLSCVFVLVMTFHYTVGKQQDEQFKRFRAEQQTKKSLDQRIKDLKETKRKLDIFN